MRERERPYVLFAVTARISLFFFFFCSPPGSSQHSLAAALVRLTDVSGGVHTIREFAALRRDQRTPRAQVVRRAAGDQLWNVRDSVYFNAISDFPSLCN
jgi:hypothetical protein